MANRVTRTYVASVRNHQQVRDDFDSLGFAASKLWNVARWTCDRIWHETGTIPDGSTLKAYLKSHERYADLNAHSSQAILEELAEAFESRYAHRKNGTEDANPPGYRILVDGTVDRLRRAHVPTNIYQRLRRPV
jgi:putative transposase